MADGSKEVLPARLIVIPNFAIITRLLTRISSAAQIAFKSVYQYVPLDGSLSPDGHPKMKAGIADSHFYLDGCSIQHPTTLSDLESSMKTPIPRYGIPNFVHRRDMTEKLLKATLNPNIHIHTVFPTR